MPRGVYDALRAYADVWSTRGVRAWDEGWWEMGAEVADCWEDCWARLPEPSPCTRT